MNLRFARWSVGLVSDITAALRSNILHTSPVAFKYAAGEATGRGAWAEVTASEHARCAPFNGKRAVVTGATRGVGREVALGLAARGWEVIGTGRSVEAGAKLAAEVAARGGRLSFAELRLDQSELGTGNSASPLVGEGAAHSVSSLMAEGTTAGTAAVPTPTERRDRSSGTTTPGQYFETWVSAHVSSQAGSAEGRPVDLLVNNAGVMGAHLPRGVVADVNCLAPASLTLALLPSLQATSLSITAYNQPAVVVNVASSAHIRASFSLLQSYDHDHGLVSCLKEALTPTESSAQELDTNRDQYANSKFGLLLFSRALRRRLAQSSQPSSSQDAVAVEEPTSTNEDVRRSVTGILQRSVVIRDCHPGLVWTCLLTASLLGAAKKSGSSKSLYETKRSSGSNDINDHHSSNLSFGSKLKAALLRPLFFSPRRGAAVVLEAALQGSAASGAYDGVTDEVRWAAESRSYFSPSGTSGVPVGLAAAGRAAVAAAEAQVRGRKKSEVQAGKKASAEEVLDDSAERVWELVHAYGKVERTTN